ncbi:MAG: Gfo/Idh/MocA family oxidoreductase [Sphingomonadaceae bacterium]
MVELVAREIFTVTKIALLGCGGWGKNLARNLSEISALHTIVDPDAKAATIAAQLNVNHVANPEVALNDPAIVGIAIATPAETHYALAMRALNAGKDVYVEKPIALTISEGEEMVRTARAARRVLMVGHILHYHPAFRRLLELVRDGAFGPLRHIISNRMSLGRLREEENVLWSFAPHDLSMICALANSMPVRARAIGAHFLSDTLEDVTSVHVDFSGGLVAEVRSSWCHPRKIQSLTVVGEHSMAVFDDTRAWPEKLFLCDYSVDRTRSPSNLVRGEERFLEVTPGEPLKLEMQHFIDCIEKRRDPVTHGAEALRVLRVLQAAQGSLEQDGAWVHV